MDSDVTWLMLPLLLVVSGFISNGCGERRGYADGCRDGSRGHSQVVHVDGARKCLPHARAIELRK